MKGNAPSITTCSEGTCWHVSHGRAHAERRAAQAAAARKRPVKRRDDIDWKKEQEQ